jgi:hypothetical protein
VRHFLSKDLGMRKATIIVSGGLGFAFLCSAVFGKEEPGSRMTFGQKMSSVFGLVDTASSTPPPAPPPTQPYNRSRPQHTTVPSNRQNNSVAIQHGGASASNPGYTSGTGMPPPPRRDDVGLQAPQPAAARQQVGEPVAKSSILMQSRAAGQPSGVVRAAPSAGGYTSRSGAAPAAAIAPIPTAAGNTSAAPTVQAPITASRRRPASQRNAEPLTDGTRGAATEVPIAAPVPTSSTSTSAPITSAPIIAAPAPKASSDDVFIPTIPMMADRRASTRSTPSADSTGVAAQPNLGTAPATLPVESSEPRPIEVAQPNLNPAAGPAFDATDTQVDTTPLRTAPATSAAGQATGTAVLAAFTSPEVTVETIGPRRISIGREAKYRVLVRNRGQAAAQNVVVSLNIPAWAEVVELHGTSGNTTSADEQAADKPLEWQLESLGARAEEELTLILIPRKSETFDLGVRWTCTPAAVATAIEVEEPQLQMSIAGPSEVSYGEQRLYKLTVANPGTGTAENVVLHLMPLSPNDGDAVSHKIGDLKAGQDTSVEVELTARQAGQLKIRTSATADGDLKSDASADVVVHRAALDVAVVAPRIVFAGVPGNYEVRVRNSGDDQARNVKVTVDLPQGAKLLTSAPTHKVGGKSNQADWVIDRLAPGAEQVFSIRCSLESGGVAQLTATTSADGDLRKMAQASTDVQSVADLALDVVDTPGPVAVGQPVTYEIHVKNRGMKSAEGVDVVAYFSEGIEPEKAEGQLNEIQPGMVVFKSLPSVGAGQDRVLKVTARATAAGNHRLRVEMNSRAPQTQLSHEDATFFYLDEAPSSTSTSSNNGSSNNASTTAGISGSSSVDHARSLRSGSRYGSSPTTAPAATASAGLSTTPAAQTTAAPTTSTPSVSPYAAATTSAPATNPTRASDNRYGSVDQAIPATLPQSSDAIRPATSVGSPNTPGTVYPAAMPQRLRQNGLR